MAEDLWIRATTLDVKNIQSRANPHYDEDAASRSTDDWVHEVDSKIGSYIGADRLTDTNDPYGFGLTDNSIRLMMYYKNSREGQMTLPHSLLGPFVVELICKSCGSCHLRINGLDSTPLLVAQQKRLRGFAYKRRQSRPT